MGGKQLTSQEQEQFQPNNDFNSNVACLPNRLTIETKFNVGDASETVSADKDISELIHDLQQRPEVGAPLQGDIFNTVSRGARRTKFYIRSASSGTGKTRAALGDACGLAYPIMFNPVNISLLL